MDIAHASLLYSLTIGTRTGYPEGTLQLGIPGRGQCPFCRHTFGKNK